MTDYTDKQALFDAINSATNSQLWAIASTISSQLKEASEITQAKEPMSLEAVGTLFDDKESARTWWLSELQKMVESGNQQAAKTLQDALGIVSASNDLSIRVVSYRDICPGCPIGAEPEPIDPNQ